jgi:hypothetical protein
MGQHHDLLDMPPPSIYFLQILFQMQFSPAGSHPLGLIHTLLPQSFCHNLFSVFFITMLFLFLLNNEVVLCPYIFPMGLFVLPSFAFDFVPCLLPLLVRLLPARLIL